MIRCAAVTLFVLSAGCNCSGGTPGGTGGGGGSSAAGGGSAGSSGTGGGGGASTFTDFPTTPVLDGIAAALPGDAGTAAAPCIVEPEDGTLYPTDWLRPRFSFVAANGEDAFELTLRTANQVNALVVYTSHVSWTMPKPMWLSLVEHSGDRDITVDVRAIKQSTGASSAAVRSTVRIAPAAASGAIVYWTTSNGTALKGFRLGDEIVTTVLVPARVPNSQCIGCHTSTPDGLYAGFSSSTQSGNGDPSGIALASVDGGAVTPPFLSTSAAQLLARQPQQAPTFSAGHWANGDHVVLSNYQSGGTWQIVWTDLEAASMAQGTGWGVIARNGDTGSPASPTFSHDGQTVAYVSSPMVSSGVTVAGSSDLFTVPYANRAGGTAAQVPAGANATNNECYPSFSPDDLLLAFARVPSPETSYNNPNAEVFVAPLTATMPHRARANDPPACLHLTSPGLTNSWPKWGPLKTVVGTKTYYWLTFSSTRVGNRPQLFVAPVVVENGTVTSYPALYLWNQPADEANHTPAWDLFQLPEIG